MPGTIPQHPSSPAERLDPVAVPATPCDCGQPQAAGPALHLAELLPVIRSRLALDPMLSDDHILASLAEIAVKGDRRERWRTAFNSTLGQWLALAGRDLNTALGLLLALVPAPRS